MQLLIAVRSVWQQFSRLNPSVYSAALRGGCCTVLIARFDVNRNKRRLLLLLLLLLDDSWGAVCAELLIRPALSKHYVTQARLNCVHS